MLTDKFGKLNFISESISVKLRRMSEWKCDCGRTKTIRTDHVTSGRISSCGQCSMISKDEMARRKFGHFIMNNPDDVMPGSAKKIEWMCDCGRIKLARISHVVSGLTSSCGHCNEFSAVIVFQMESNGLTLIVTSSKICNFRLVRMKFRQDGSNR